MVKAPAPPITCLLYTSFESSACEYEGVECWSARELYPFLGYAKWQTFENVLGKAKEACQNAGVETSNHFTGISKTILMPKGCLLYTSRCV